MKHLPKAVILIVFTLFSSTLFARENPNSILSKGIKYRFGENSVLSFRFGTQVWARYMQTNPGTLDIDKKPVNDFFDIGLRRTRFALYAGFMDDKFVAYTQLGMNSQSFSSSAKPQMYFHDVWSAFQLFDGGLYIGMGLHGWAGVTRMNSASYASNMMVDNPGFNLPNLSRTDQSGRQIGIFLKGNMAKFNYRFAINKPFVRNELSTIDIDNSVYYPNSNSSYTGYVFYSLLDEEKFKSSYVTLSYLGKKKILNIGAGFDIHPQSMASLNISLDTVIHDKNLFGFDVFLDYPFKNDAVLTLYSAFYLYDFGPNYIRTYGAMNPLSEGDLPQGGGNNHFNVGTGDIFYTALGFILPENMQPFSGKIQPVAAVHYKNFDALGSPSVQYDAGINYYISGHNAKINLQYSNWAVYNNYHNPGTSLSGQKVTEMKGMIILQVQMFL